MTIRQDATLTFSGSTRVFREAGIIARAMLPVAPPDGQIDPTWKVDRKSLGKAPGRFNAKIGTWRGLSGDFVQEGVSKGDQETFATWPTGNVGLLGRAYPAIDSDAATEAGQRLIERVMVETFGAGSYAERLRGDAPRRLYAFQANRPSDAGRVIANRSVKFTLPSEPEHAVHGVDILGAGKQYLIAGIHPSGDVYRWQGRAALTSPATVRRLARIEEADMARFVAALEAEVEAAGGTIRTSGSGGAGSGELRDFSDADPAMRPAAVLTGLGRLPNTESSFPSRDDLVRVLGAVRAALGCEADAAEADIREWATRDPAWCDDDYFDRIWRSLDGGVRVGQDALDHLFRQHGIGIGAQSAFPDDAEAVSAALRARIAENRDARTMTLAEVARRYVFGEVNIRTDDNSARVRSLARVTVEWDAAKWWRGRTDDAEAPGLLREIQSFDGWDHGEDGMWSFLRDLKAAHPDVFYAGETLDPRHDRGEIIEERDESDRVTYRLNMRELSRVQRLARQPSKKPPTRDEEDVQFLLEFMGRVFGRHVSYELDTLSYMVQSGRRPGHLLFLVGDQGTGKSAYTQMLATMFDGSGRASAGGIDGNKLTNDGAVRFAFAKAGGRRILEIRELPERSPAGSQAAVTSILKQLVDPGPSGDFVQVEQKGKDPEAIANFARVVITSNYGNAIQVEAQDRRIFYVHCGINLENKPDDAYYAELFSIINDPERLAAFWRYLRKRDISRYRVTAHPPISNEKLEQQIGGIENPWVRHAWAAVMVLQAAGRRFFDMDEFRRIMDAMSYNEFRNTNGALGDARNYDFRSAGAQGQAALKRLELHAEKVASFRSNGARVPTIYAMKGAERESLKLLNAKRHEVLSALERDRAEHPLSEDHRVTLFRGPPTIFDDERR